MADTETVQLSVTSTQINSAVAKANGITKTAEQINSSLSLADTAQQRTTVTDTTSTTITLANAAAGTDYVYGTLTSLTVSANDTSLSETTIQFTADTTITVTLPATLTYIGSEPTFEASTSYVIAIFNNKCIVGKVAS